MAIQDIETWIFYGKDNIQIKEVKRTDAGMKWRTKRNLFAFPFPQRWQKVTDAESSFMNQVHHPKLYYNHNESTGKRVSLVEHDLLHKESHVHPVNMKMNNDNKLLKTKVIQLSALASNLKRFIVSNLGKDGLEKAMSDRGRLDKAQRKLYASEFHFLGGKGSSYPGQGSSHED